MYTLNNDFELSKTTLNHANKRDLYVEYFKYDSKKDNEECGHTLFITHEKYSHCDGGITFSVKEFKKGDFIAKFKFSDIEEDAKILALFEKNPEMKVIHGEKELRKFIKMIEKLF